MNSAIFLALMGLQVSDSLVGSNCVPEVVVEELPAIVDIMGDAVDEDSMLVNEPQARWEVLPHGELSGDDLIAILERWEEESPSFQEMLTSLNDGHYRRISREALQEAVDLAGFLLPDFVPLDQLEEIVIEGGTLTVRFEKDLKIDQDAQEILVLDEIDSEDPFLVDWDNPPRLHETTSYTLKINRELQFEFSNEGLHSVREGDLVGSKFIFSRAIDLRSTHGVPDVQRLEGALVLAVDADGEPLVDEGRYVGVEASEWLEVIVGGETTRLPIPQFGTSTPAP